MPQQPILEPVIKAIDTVLVVSQEGLFTKKDLNQIEQVRSFVLGLNIIICFVEIQLCLNAILITVFWPFESTPRIANPWNASKRVALAGGVWHLAFGISHFAFWHFGILVFGHCQNTNCYGCEHPRIDISFGTNLLCGGCYTAGHALGSTALASACLPKT